MSVLPDCDFTDPEDPWSGPCPDKSRFRVVRADGDSSFGPTEACPRHLPDAIADILEGLPIAATVTVHWDDLSDLDTATPIAAAFYEHKGMGICGKGRTHQGPCDYGNGV